VDGTCNGASSITITALGWGQSAQDINTFPVTFNNQPATLSKVIYSIANATWSGTSIVARVPDLGLDRGISFGVIQLNNWTKSTFQSSHSSVSLLLLDMFSLREPLCKVKHHVQMVGVSKFGIQIFRTLLNLRT